ncbi:hypothetical protein [Spongiibacter marinus]|uniref:hypothetical protein n=1 Tax=Spongiibacter marinus TaxID=354246 RepID=UPI0003FDBDBD|nr:hypothetical protein [Spongiibacter marinus]
MVVLSREVNRGMSPRSEEDRRVLSVYTAQLRAVASELEDEACDIILLFMEITSALDRMERDGGSEPEDVEAVRNALTAITERLQMFDSSAQRLGHIADSAERMKALDSEHSELATLASSYSCPVEHDVHRQVCNEAGDALDQ